MTARDWLDIAGGATIIFGMMVVWMQACEIDRWQTRALWAERRIEEQREKLRTPTRIIS